MAGTSLLLRSATKYLGVSKYHAMAEVGPSHAESSSQRSAASFASFSQPLSPVCAWPAEKIACGQQELCEEESKTCNRQKIKTS